MTIPWAVGVPIYHRNLSSVAQYYIFVVFIALQVCVTPPHNYCSQHTHNNNNYDHSFVIIQGLSIFILYVPFAKEVRLCHHQSVCRKTTSNVKYNVNL